MKLLKQLLLIFFVGLGIQKVVHDILLWIDADFFANRDDGYFSVLAFAILYFSVRHFKQSEAEQPRQTN